MYHGEGARNFARKFYKSKMWERKSRLYRKQHPYCERCMEKGIYEPARLVHHKVHIDASNYRDPEILLSDSNLEALCKQCHYEEHNKKESLRFNPDGSILL